MIKETYSECGNEFVVVNGAISVLIESVKERANVRIREAVYFKILEAFFELS